MCTLLVAMSSLADAVLPLIRTRADLSRWGAANAHGGETHGAIEVLEAARPCTDPAEFHSVASTSKPWCRMRFVKLCGGR
jgi:hypothetical protein